jgi:hypothetical protein
MAENSDTRTQKLKLEKSRLDESFPEILQIIDREIERIETGFESDKFIELHQNPAKVEFRVKLPVKEYPQANFVGRLVGPSGATIKDLQATSGCRIAVFGRGSIKDRAKEEDLRKQGGKYAHLNHDLHVHLYATGNTVSCYKRIALAMELIEPLLAPEFREDGQPMRGPGDAFGIAPPPRHLMPRLPGHRGGMAGWPTHHVRGMPPGVRGRGAAQAARGVAGAAAGGRGAPRGRGSAGANRASPRGRGAAGGRGQPRGAPRLAAPVATEYQPVDAYEYEAAYGSQSYLDPNAYATAEASDAYYEYGQSEAQAYDPYGGAWGEEALETPSYGKVSSGRSASSYRSHPYQ